ncbi:MAG: hypothetical protein K0R39_3903 [Symbiobacteriaceae bacterium]|jgi:uncharacterized membrane protein YgcG|nr:hypothetical protein [Symbiobacteriaceae bacterium]
MTRKALLLVTWLCALLVLVGRPAAAATSPAGIVNDESGTFSAQQLAQLDEALSGLTVPFRVIVVNTAFPGGRPADADVQFQNYADRLLQERVPPDAVLVTVSMQDRLVDFRVWADGPVNQAFLDKAGRQFGDFSGAMLDAYRGPARAGDVPGGIIAAARVVEGVVAAPPVTVPDPAPSPSPSPSPAPSYPSPAPSYPSPAPSLPGETVWTGPNPQTPPANPWPWVGGVALLGTAVYWTVAFRRYRIALREALEVRDRFLGGLLELMERDLPLARKYQGEETLAKVTAASAAVDTALHTEQEAEALRLQAERFAKFQRFARARSTMKQATEAYQRAEALFRDAEKAWEPVVDAMLNWEKDQADVGAKLAATGTALSAEKVRTGWPLTDLGARLGREEAQLTLARSSRDEDPVRAVRLAREAGAAADVLSADLGAVPGLTEALAAQRKRRAAAEASVELARRELGLRFVELPPEPPLARTLQAEEDAATALPPGEVGRVRESLALARAASDEAEAIVARYREALKQYPEKSAALSRELAAALPSEERLAANTLGDLRARFAAEDWDDVRTVADDLARFQAEARGALAEVARMTGPAVQLYLQAVTLLDDMLARREALGEQLKVLTARPGALEALAAEARQSLAALDRSLTEADEVALNGRVILPSDVAAQLDDARRTYRLAQQQGQEVPLPANRWARAAADGAAVAAAALQAVREVARLAAAARAELARAQSEGNSALGYERYDRRGNAMTLRGALVSAESALAAGHYQAALADAQQAINAARGLEMAYREYVAAQMEAERRGREAAEAARRAQESHNSSHSSSSGGGGSWGSGGGSNKSSGGGGSW